MIKDSFLARKAEDIYQRMLQSIAGINSPSITEHSENAFREAVLHWQEMRSHLKNYRFISVEEEIYFFKIIKPRFLSESEYYSLVHFSETFPGETDFWSREFKRAERFTNRHALFFLYYTGGLTDRDHLVFTRGNAVQPDYSFDKTRSGFDLLAGQYLGLLRYQEYTQKKL